MKPFDETKYYLGKLCKRGHDYDGTGKSLMLVSIRGCRVCKKESMSKYLLTHKESEKKHRLKNKDKKKEYLKKYYMENKERSSEYAKEYYLKNKDKKKEFRLNNKKYTKEYYLKNKEILLKKHKVYALKNKVYKKEYSKEYHSKISKELTDVYLRSQLAKNGLKSNKVTHEMIEVKRQQLIIFRGIRDIRKDIKDGVNTE